MVKQLIILLLCATMAQGADYMRGVGRTGGLALADPGPPGMLYSQWLADAVLWYPFPRDSAPGTYYDYSKTPKNGEQATSGSRPTWSSTAGGCFDFDGSADYYVTSTNIPGIPANASDMTVTLWIKSDEAVNNSVPVGRWNVNPNNYWRIIFASTGYFRFERAVSTALRRAQSATGYNNNAWHFVACGYSTAATAAFMYMDGVLDSTASSVGHTTPTGNEPVSIGRQGNASSYYDGLLDDIRIYSRVMTSNEIVAIFNENKSKYGL